MANSFYLHAGNPELVSGLRAVRMFKNVQRDRSDLGVILGRYEKQVVKKGRHTEVRRVPEKASSSCAIWTHREFKPFVRDGKVHDASIVRVKSAKGGMLVLLSAPTGDGKFIVHLETGIPKHWDMDAVANFMQGVKPGEMKTHGSERVDDGSENVLAHRIRWQRPRKGVAGSVDTLNPSKGVRIYSGDAWLMSPGAQILVHDITGKAFRVVCEKDGPKVIDPGTSDPFGTFIDLVQARKARNVAADAAAADTSSTPPAAPQPAKSGGWFGR
jgi:hypothetical protein